MQNDIKNIKIVLSGKVYEETLNFLSKQPYESVAPLISQIVNEANDNSKNFDVSPKQVMAAPAIEAASAPTSAETTLTTEPEEEKVKPMTVIEGDKK